MSSKASRNAERFAVGGALFLASFFTGMGVGFLIGNIPAGMFMGMGAGFGLSALPWLMRREPPVYVAPQQEEWEHESDREFMRNEQEDLYEELSDEAFRDEKNQEYRR